PAAAGCWSRWNIRSSRRPGRRSRSPSTRCTRCSARTGHPCCSSAATSWPMSRASSRPAAARWQRRPGGWSTPARPDRTRMRQPSRGTPMLRWSLRITLLVAAVGLALLLAAWWALHASLPRLDGEDALGGLAAPVEVTRDALGVVTLEAGGEADALRALGYVHAQERFFEMDLMRRSPAGELSALFGPMALDTDRAHRVHRMRARARATV